jgi:uncharacterized membrane protein YuzA (DUF378 family)
MPKMVMRKKILETAALIIVIIGGFNCGLVGLFSSKGNLVNLIFKPIPVMIDIFHTLVGISAVYLIITFNKIGKR